MTCESSDKKAVRGSERAARKEASAIGRHGRSELETRRARRFRITAALAPDDDERDARRGKHAAADEEHVRHGGERGSRVEVALRFRRAHLVLALIGRSGR